MRVKIGPYSSDLGKVVSVDYNADTAHVKVKCTKLIALMTADTFWPIGARWHDILSVPCVLHRCAWLTLHRRGSASCRRYYFRSSIVISHTP